MGREEGLAVIDVSVVHPAANSFLQQVAHTAGARGSLRTGRGKVLQIQWRQAGSSFAPSSIESLGCLGWPVMQFLRSLADAAASSATAGSDDFVCVALDVPRGSRCAGS
jgi:hypothetical protein